jgi:1,4-dihydroxy-2-naphthoate polyprenyltransferase
MELIVTLPVYTALVVAIAVIRLAELSLSKRNRERMRARGAIVVREPHFGAMVLVHIGILLGSVLEAWLVRRPALPVLAAAMLAVLLAAMALRWWTIRSLGAHWNVAIMDSIDKDGSDRFAVAVRGPFRWLRHPNYVAVFCELCALPLVHTAWISASLGAIAHVWVLFHRVRTEEAMLLSNPSYRKAMLDKPRFVPLPLLLRGLRAGVAFVRLGRPVFLVGGVAMYGLGVAVALAEGARFSLSIYLLGQAAISSFQLMTHYANDYFDYEADGKNSMFTRWTGGSRILPRGELPRWSALFGALVAGAAGLFVVAVISALHPVAYLWPLSLSILGLAWFYSAPPLRLHSTGFGELDGTLVVAILVPLFGFSLHNPSPSGLGRLALVIAPVALLQFSMLMAVAIPDAASDVLVDKRTLAVRLGLGRSLQCYALTAAGAFASVPMLVILGLPARIGVSLSLLAPLAVWRAWKALKLEKLEGESRRILAFWGATLFTLAALAEIAGLLFRT